LFSVIVAVCRGRYKGVLALTARMRRKPGKFAGLKGTMAHIKVDEKLPGIRGLFAFRPETAMPMSELAEVLLHTPGTLSLAERELIATYVS
jgi:hypothetical protein